MTHKAAFYHAGCPVCVDAESRIAEARSAGIKSVPALLVHDVPLHINHGADLAELG